jgi:hypothetical protein
MHIPLASIPTLLLTWHPPVVTGVVHLGPRLSVNCSPLFPIVPLCPPLQNPNPYLDFPEPNVHLIKARLNPLPSIPNRGVWGLGHLGEPDSSQLMLEGMVSHLRMGEGRVPSRLIKVIIQLYLEGGGTQWPQCDYASTRIYVDTTEYTECRPYPHIDICSLNIILLASLVAGREPQCTAGAD